MQLQPLNSRITTETQFEFLDSETKIEQQVTPFLIAPLAKIVAAYAAIDFESFLDDSAIEVSKLCKK